MTYLACHFFNPLSVTPISVIPAKAGTQGKARCIEGFTIVLVARSCRLPWAPAFAGVTSLSARISNKNQVISLSLFLKIFIQQCFQRFLLYFLPTAVRFCGEDRLWGNSTDQKSDG